VRSNDGADVPLLHAPAKWHGHEEVRCPWVRHGPLAHVLAQRRPSQDRPRLGRHQYPVDLWATRLCHLPGRPALVDPTCFIAFSCRGGEASCVPASSTSAFAANYRPQSELRPATDNSIGPEMPNAGKDDRLDSRRLAGHGGPCRCVVPDVRRNAVLRRRKLKLLRCHGRRQKIQRHTNAARAQPSLTPHRRHPPLRAASHFAGPPLRPTSPRTGAKYFRRLTSSTFGWQASINSQEFDTRIARRRWLTVCRSACRSVPAYDHRTV